MEHSSRSARGTISYAQSQTPARRRKHSCVQDKDGVRGRQRFYRFNNIDWVITAASQSVVEDDSTARAQGEVTRPKPRLCGLVRATRLGDGNTCPNRGRLISFTRRDHDDSIPLGRAEEALAGWYQWHRKGTPKIAVGSSFGGFTA